MSQTVSIVYMEMAESRLDLLDRSRGIYNSTSVDWKDLLRIILREDSCQTELSVCTYMLMS